VSLWATQNPVISQSELTNGLRVLELMVMEGIGLSLHATKVGKIAYEYNALLQWDYNHSG